MMDSTLLLSDFKPEKTEGKRPRFFLCSEKMCGILSTMKGGVCREVLSLLWKRTA